MFFFGNRKMERGASAGAVLGVVTLMVGVGVAVTQQSRFSLLYRGKSEMAGRFDQRHKAAVARVASLVKTGALTHDGTGHLRTSTEISKKGYAPPDTIACVLTGSVWKIPDGKSWCFMNYNRSSPNDGKVHALVYICEKGGLGPNPVYPPIATAEKICGVGKVAVEVDIKFDSYSNEAKVSTTEYYGEVEASSSYGSSKVSSVPTGAPRPFISKHKVFVGSSAPIDERLDASVNFTDFCFFMRPNFSNYGPTLKMYNGKVEYNKDGKMVKRCGPKDDPAKCDTDGFRPLSAQDLEPRPQGVGAGEYSGTKSTFGEIASKDQGTYMVMTDLQWKVLEAAESGGYRGFSATVVNTTKDKTVFLGVEPNEGKSGAQFQYYLADDQLPGKGYSHNARCMDGTLLAKWKKNPKFVEWTTKLGANFSACRNYYEPERTIKNALGNSSYSSACVNATGMKADFCNRVDMPWATTASKLTTKCVEKKVDGWGKLVTKTLVKSCSAPTTAPMPVATVCPTATPTATPFGAPTATPTATPFGAPTATPTATPFGAPTATPMATPPVCVAVTPTPVPTLSPADAKKLSDCQNLYDTYLGLKETAKGFELLLVAYYKKQLDTHCSGVSYKCQDEYDYVLPSSFSYLKDSVSLDLFEQVSCDPEWPNVVKDIITDISVLSPKYSNGTPVYEVYISELGALLDLDVAGMNSMFKRIKYSEGLVIDAIKARVSNMKGAKGSSDKFEWSGSLSDGILKISDKALYDGYTTYSRETLSTSYALEAYEAKRCVYMRYHDMALPGKCRVTMFASDEIDAACRTSDGCFAAATLIRMADGSDRAVSTLRRGELVWNPVTQMAATVERLTVGPEKRPMIRVTVMGRFVDVTDGHPFMTSSGWKKAGDLKLGEMVMSDGGILAAVEGLVALPVGDEPPEVWNLALQGQEENDHYLLANGVVTGDLMMQEKIGKR